MPALSSAPPSSTPSPLVGLGDFVVTVILVSGVCFVGRRIINKISTQARAANAGDASSVVFKEGNFSICPGFNAEGMVYVPWSSYTHLTGSNLCQSPQKRPPSRSSLRASAVCSANRTSNMHPETSRHRLWAPPRPSPLFSILLAATPEDTPARIAACVPAPATVVQKVPLSRTALLARIHDSDSDSDSYDDSYDTE
ncbi:hypothetical protein B0H17DRAFT_1214594 [Mycena rosella]|uniref:Uncharacterized protein n=1 Tax=Mycena rosella TaxID=1033263 RepID=A0AAD7CND3_MYCRO|nr:hypothetical protein B0H17DRAFT_1214594 [Mycena rosella]